MKQYNKKLIGDRIKYLRNRAGIQQDELAHILQMSRTNISNYESGRVSPPSTVIFALAELFSVSADFLLGREDSLMLHPMEKELEELKAALIEIKRILHTVNNEKHIEEIEE